MHQFSDKKENFEFLSPNFPKNRFWGQNFKNVSLDLESASFWYYVYQFSDKTDNENFPKSEFWGQNFITLGLDSKSARPI